MQHKLNTQLPVYKYVWVSILFFSTLGFSFLCLRVNVFFILHVLMMFYVLVTHGALPYLPSPPPPPPWVLGGSHTRLRAEGVVGT
jgi:hypothetical protein